MGINGWFKVYSDSALVRKEKDFKDKRLGIDVSYDIYRASLGMKNIKGLTDKNGTPTILLNTLLCNVVKYKKLGVKGLVYVFDNPKPNAYKVKEAKKRKKAREKAEEDLAKETQKEIKHKLEKRTFTITDEMVEDVKKLLTLLGVAWIVAPEGYEAEHLGAELTMNNIIDSFITSDSDTLLFGGKSMIRRIKNKDSTKLSYEEYILEEVMVDYDLTREQLIHQGVVLGSDFAEKTKGIGPGTILKKGLDTKLTKEQQKAKEYFLSRCPYNHNMIKKDVADKKGLIKWLEEDKNFNKKRIEKLLSVFYVLI